MPSVAPLAPGDATDPVLSLGGRNTGGWRLRTEEATGRYRVEETDYFGHTTWKRDLGGHTYNFSYNDAGQLVQQTSSAGQNIVYTYLQNGNVYEIKDVAQRLLTRYAYDDAGNRDGESYGRLSSSGAGMLELWQASRIQYDERNRIARVFDNSTGNDIYSANLYKTHDLRYEYDAVGNRRAAIALYWDPINFSRGLLQRDDHWYVYDAANRFTLTKGSLAGARGSATIVQGSQGVSLTYDKAGQRTSALQANGDLERYTYSSDGYLEDTHIKLAGQSAETRGARRRVDAAGRTIQYLEYSSGSGSLRQSKLSVFDADNRIQRDAITEGSLGVQSTQYSYYDSGKGAMRESVTTAGSTTTAQTWTYEYWDSAKQSTIDSKVNGYVVVNTSTLSYDFNGHLKGVTDSSAGGRYFGYFSDAQGVVLRRSESKEGKTYATFYFYADDRRVGDVSTDPTARNNRISYAELLAQDPHAKPKDRFKDLQPITSADFDQSYEPINANYPGSAATSYVARTGDTLRSIARSLWGDAAMWYVLADANALSVDATLSNGQVLVIPNKVTNIHNNADTFRPYNPGEAIGSIDPTAPTPPPPVADKGCGVMGQMIMIVVAVVATVVTAGAAAVALGAASLGAATTGVAMASMAVGSAVGSIASQAVGMAMGNVQDFSWKAVGQAALGGAISGGITAYANSAGSALSFLGNGGWEAAAGRAALSSGATMALRNDWSWRNVMLSAVSAGVSAAVGGTAGGQAWAKAAGGIGGRLAGGLAGALTARALTGSGRGSYETVFASTLGNAIGGSLASGNNYSRWGTDDTETQRLLARYPAPATEWEVVQAADWSRPPAENASVAEVMAYDMRRAGFEGELVPTSDRLRLDLGSPNGIDGPLSGLSDEELIAKARAVLSQGNSPTSARASYLAAQAKATSDLYASGAGDVRTVVTLPDSLTSVQRISAEPLSMSMQAAQVAIESTISAIAEVPAMAIDLVHVGVGTLYTAVTGQPDYVPMLSSLGKAGMGDASTTDLLHSLNPVYGLMVGSYEARQGLERGDTRPLAAFSGSLLGGGIAAYATPSLPGYRPGVFSPATVNAANRVAGSAKSAIYSLLPDVPDITVNPFPPELSRGATVLPKLPYSDSTRRPAYRPTQVPDVWKAAQDAQGRVFDPNRPDIELFWDTTKPRNGQWDMGHTQGNDYHSLYKDYMNRKLTPEEFLREYRDPENYRPESPSENRGRRHDRPRN
jgi:YD repeat-containing protein